MKTATYLRWSLLIPFVVWGLSLLVFLLLSKLPASESFMDPIESMSFLDAVTIFLAGYVFGVILWIFPYLLLALILFFWSFIGKAQTMIKAFALSPVVMALLTIAILIIFDLGGNSGSVLSEVGGLGREWINLNLLFAGIALAWGYICVGIGYGMYRLLQRRGIIRDEEVLPAPQSV